MADNGFLCLDNTQPTEVSFNGLNIGAGSIVSAWDNLSDPNTTLRNCITLTGNTDEPAGPVTAVTIYNNCYECLADNYTTITLQSCDTGDQFFVDISEFGMVPVDQTVYFLELTTTGGTIVGCFLVKEIGQNSKETYELLELNSINLISTSSFPDCDTCLYGFSANTEYISCTICCPCDTGSTATESVVPHPVATNLFGQTVVQLNAVQLGGQNGLYA